MPVRGGGPPERMPQRLPSGMTRYTEPRHPRAPRQAGHMTTYVMWPIVVAFLISCALGGARFGWLALDGEDLDVAATKGARWFLITFPPQVLIYLLLLMRAWGGPVRLAEIQNPRPRPKMSRPRSYPIPMNSKGSRLQDTNADKWARAWARVGERARKGLRKAGERMEQPPRRRRRKAAFTQETRTVEAKVKTPETWLMETLYRDTNKMYHRCLTRRSFEIAYPEENGQALYAQYKDWWTRLGWVNVDGRGTMTWRFEEHELYESDRKLKEIAADLGFKFPGEGQDALGA